MYRSMTFLQIAFVLAIGFSLASGCSSVRVIVPTPRIEAPEVPGKTGMINLGVGIVPAENLKFIDDASARPPDFTHTELIGAAAIPVSAGVGLSDRFEAGADLVSMGGSNCGELSGKFQITGDPRVLAKRGSAPASVFGRIGNCGATNSGNQDALFGPGGFPWKASATARYSELGASIGYRAQDLVLIFAGLAHANYDSHISVTQDVSRDGSSAGGSYSASAKASATSASAGLNWGGTQVWLNTQIVYTDFHWSGTSNYHTELSLLLGWGL
jgi:hypothetical protein